MEFCRVQLVIASLFLMLAAGTAMAQDNPWQIGPPAEFRGTHSGSGSPRQDRRTMDRFAPENYSARGYWRESGNQGSSTNEQYQNEQPNRYGVPPADSNREADNDRYREQSFRGRQVVPGPQGTGGSSHKREFAQDRRDENTVHSRGELIPNSANSHATDPVQRRQNSGRVYGEFPPLNHNAGRPPEQKTGRDDRRYSDNRGSNRNAYPPNAYPPNAYPPAYGGYYPGMTRPAMPGMPGPSTFGNPYGGLGGIYLNPYGPGIPGAW